MLEKIIQWDRETFLYLNGLGTENWDAFWLFMTDKWSSIPLYVLLLILAYRALGVKRTIIFLVLVTLLITCTDQLSNFFKYGVQRLRPCHDSEIAEVMRLVKSYCGGKFAYFSAHAANSFAVVSFFVFMFRKKYVWIVPLLILWGCIVGYSRIYIGVHFPLDVLTGIFVGGFFGWLYYKLYIFAAQKFRL